MTTIAVLKSIKSNKEYEKNSTPFAVCVICRRKDT